ncbi:MAG TPA: hypothetical protein VN886_08720 [Acidimicrobiales bacterium]|nr:hypothetical protein [Acidimicrobiales bacterium]
MTEGSAEAATGGKGASWVSGCWGKQHPAQDVQADFLSRCPEFDKGVLVMAVLIENVFPVGVTNELLDAVTDEMGVDAELPAGGIVHVHFEKDGRAHGVDVWDSVEAYQQFVQSTLVPAMGKVAVARGLDPSQMGEPEVTITEVHRLVH